MSDQAKYLKKAVKVTCTDKRVVYGILVCISSPFSIILQNAIAQHPQSIKLDLEFHYAAQFPAKYFTNDESISFAYERLAKAQNEEEKAQLLLKVEEAKQFNNEFMKDKYMVGSVIIPGEFIENQIINDIQLFEKALNYNLLTSPFVPNTFSLWREVKYQQISQDEVQLFQEAVDQKIFKIFLDRVREQYKLKMTYNDLKIDLKIDIDQKKMKEVIENDLKQETDDLVALMSVYQSEVEYAYDLLRRINTYKIIEYENKYYIQQISDTINKLQFQQDQKQKFYTKYLDKMMNGLLINVQEISTEKIKQFCATGLIKNYSLWDSSKGFLKTFIFSGVSAMKKVTNLNVGLFIGGLIAEAIVQKVGIKILAKTMKSKLEDLHQQLQEMTNALIKLNYQLDQLIYQAVMEKYTDKWESHQKNISLFLQKNYKVQAGNDVIYCPETNDILEIKDQGSMVIVTQHKYQVEVIEDDEFSIISIKESPFSSEQEQQSQIQQQQQQFQQQQTLEYN